MTLVDRLLVADADPLLRSRCAQALRFPGREVVEVEPRAVPARLDDGRWEGLVLGWGSGPGEAYAMALATGLPDEDRPAVVLLARDVTGSALRAAFTAGATDVVGVEGSGLAVDDEHLAAVVLGALDEVLLARPGHVLPEPLPAASPASGSLALVPLPAPPAPVPAGPPPSLSSLVARLRAEIADEDGKTP